MLPIIQTERLLEIFNMEQEKIFQDKDFNRQPFKVELYTAAAVIFFIAAAMSVHFFQSDADPSFHAEIFPSDAISYIKDNELVALSDGDYMLAMPAGGTFVNGVAPMLLIEVEGNFYPLNIADDSILPRQGRQLPLRIMFGFTSPHAENKLKYEEKSGKDPIESYKKKAYYFLRVKDGFGNVERFYKIKD